MFKTPWEVFQEGRSYDVVIATVDEIPAIDARLLVVYGASVKSSDAQANITARTRLRDVTLNYQGICLPIYGEMLTFEETGTSVLCVTDNSEIAGLRVDTAGLRMFRLGYDVFRETAYLLSVGQPVKNAQIPTLEIHIMILRNCILDAGIPLLEIPPVPAGYSFAVCLTHDIDFAGIRRHKFDHTMWGFLYRSTVGALRDFRRKRISGRRLLSSWQAAASLPFVYLGLAKDFWLQFDEYLQIEKNLPATYFMIPFKNCAGDRVSVKHPKRRAAAYDITDLADWTAALIKEGCEIGVHGVDAWHSCDKGREELSRVAAVTGKSDIGVRIHWLLRDENSFRVLEEAGYAYDSTAGYNETVGYRCGTTQVFRPLGTQRLLELPLHIQDGAMFFPQRLDLSEAQARQLCETLIQKAKQYGGVLTILWHDRSLGPERFWGDFYARLVDDLRSSDIWFGTAAQVVNWFRKRREVAFDCVWSVEGTARSDSSLRRGTRSIPP